MGEVWDSFEDGSQDIADALRGKKSGPSKERKRIKNAALLQAQLAEQLFEQTDPVRTALLGRASDFLDGGLDVTASPAYEFLQGQTATNFNRAKDNLIARTAPGGALVDALSDLEGQRAMTLSSGAAGLFDQELNRAMALGTGITGTSLGSLGMAGQTQANLAAMNAQADAQKTGSTMQAAAAVASK